MKDKTEALLNYTKRFWLSGSERRRWQAAVRATNSIGRKDLSYKCLVQKVMLDLKEEFGFTSIKTRRYNGLKKNKSNIPQTIYNSITKEVCKDD